MSASCGSVRRARPLLGTLVEIRVSAGQTAGGRAIERAFSAIERVHRAMSAQESTSDIARLRAGHRLGLDRWTRRVLERAEELRSASDGLFDCACCGYALDGIAKGFAVDRAIEVLRDAGVGKGAVNAGGDLRLFGPDAEDVYVRLPQKPARLWLIGRVREAAVATSGRALLVDPRGAGRTSAALGVTVIAADCTTADALTKPCLLEPDRAPELAGRFGAQALVFRAP
ncbi:MAG: FAD:protein FMN transferase [Burkholderiales bacterium]